MAITKQIAAVQKQKLNARPLAKITANEALGEINRDFGERKTAARAGKLKLEYIDILNSPINADLAAKVDLAAARTALALPFFQIGKKNPRRGRRSGKNRDAEISRGNAEKRSRNFRRARESHRIARENRTNGSAPTAPRRGISK